MSQAPPYRYVTKLPTVLYAAPSALIVASIAVASQSRLLYSMERLTGSKWIKVHDHDNAMTDDDALSTQQDDDEQLLATGGDESSSQVPPTPFLLQKPVAPWAVFGLGALFLLVVILVVRGGLRHTRFNSPVATAEGPKWLDLLPPDMVVHMNHHIDPCVDFYDFSCGAWLDNVEIPDDKSTFALSFTTVHDENQAVLKQLMAQNWPLVSELYDSCMNYSNESSAAADAAAFEVLAPTLRQITATTSKTELLQLAGKISRTGPSFLSDFSIAADAKDATVYALYASQTGLSLPDPEYYLNATKFATVHDAFQTYMTTLFRLVGFNTTLATTQAQAVIGLQQQLAALFVPKEQLQDPQKTYNRMKLAHAADLYPFLIAAFLNGTELLADLLANQTDVIVTTPVFFDQAETLVSSPSVPLATLQATLLYQYISFHAMTLSASYVTAKFTFAMTLRGQKTLPARWKFCLGIVTESFPDLVGKYYALVRFDEASLHLATALVTALQATLHHQLRHLDWLDDPTRRAAILKLDQMTNLIGHSTHKKHFPFTLHAEASLAANMQVLDDYEFDEAVAKLGTRVDRTMWAMTGAAANAYYQSSANQIVFPAGILQPPFFSRTYHVARNFGSIGTIIGHELTHGFDAHGRYFDGDGNLNDWWSRTTSEEFTNRTDCLVAQYNRYHVPSDFDKDKVVGYVNGNYTLSENLADNGGVKLAFAAYHDYQARANDTNDNGNVSAMAADRLFFLSFAQTFCAKSRDGSMTERLASDPHTPGRWRVNGVASNSHEFAAAFSCAANSPMNPTTKCQLW